MLNKPTHKSVFSMFNHEGRFEDCPLCAPLIELAEKIARERKRSGSMIKALILAVVLPR